MFQQRAARGIDWLTAAHQDAEMLPTHIKPKTVVARSVLLPLSWINNSQMVFPRHDHGIETLKAWMKSKGGLPDSGGIETSRPPCRINRIHQHLEHGDLQ